MSLAKLKSREDVIKARPPRDDIVWKAAAIAIAIGALACALLIYGPGGESYSALYLKQNSYDNHASDGRARFSYGVTSYASGRTDYYLKVFLAESQVASKQFYIDGRGNSMEDSVSFEVPPKTAYPAKVSLVLTDGKQEYTAHYWLRGAN